MFYSLFIIPLIYFLFYFKYHSVKYKLNWSNFKKNWKNCPGKDK